MDGNSVVAHKLNAKFPTKEIFCCLCISTDTLLCHDDELEGRRIAFIYYLVPEWTKEDGGTFGSVPCLVLMEDI